MVQLKSDDADLDVAPMCNSDLDERVDRWQAPLDSDDYPQSTQIQDTQKSKGENNHISFHRTNSTGDMVTTDTALPDTTCGLGVAEDMAPELGRNNSNRPPQKPTTDSSTASTEHSVCCRLSAVPGDSLKDLPNEKDGQVKERRTQPSVDFAHSLHLLVGLDRLLEADSELQMKLDIEALRKIAWSQVKQHVEDHFPPPPLEPALQRFPRQDLCDGNPWETPASLYTHQLHTDKKEKTVHCSKDERDQIPRGLYDNMMSRGKMLDLFSAPARPTRAAPGYPWGILHILSVASIPLQVIISYIFMYPQRGGIAAILRKVACSIRWALLLGLALGFVIGLML